MGKEPMHCQKPPPEGSAEGTQHRKALMRASAIALHISEGYVAAATVLKGPESPDFRNKDMVCFVVHFGIQCESHLRQMSALQFLRRY